VLAPDEALLKVEASGMCGTDHGQYDGSAEHGGLFRGYPFVLGHEPVGEIVAIGDRAEVLWGVGLGDRVVVEPIVPCGVCRDCRSGSYRLCPNRHVYSYGRTDEPPGLWGSHAEYMFLRANTAVHKVPDELSSTDAALFNAVGCGIDWALDVAGTRVGDTVLVLGCGQRGLATAVALQEAGAEQVIVTGLERDRFKLDLAIELGAHQAIVVDSGDTVDAVMEATASRGVDRVIDTTPGATQPIVDAVAVTRPGGTIALAGAKGNLREVSLVVDAVALRGLRLVGAVGVSSWAYGQAVRLLASGKYPLSRLHTHSFSLDEAEYALSVLAGEVEGEQGIHIQLHPGRSGSTGTT